ncbi:MAG TPA: hypothetical protein PLN92_02500, partial [Thermotogota bacterium]|nr:hypothetical protein [Thermotogota bacterium]
NYKKSLSFSTETPIVGIGGIESVLSPSFSPPSANTNRDRITKIINKKYFFIAIPLMLFIKAHDIIIKESI